MRAGGLVLALLACGPAWAARSALATIPGDEDSGPAGHLIVAVAMLAIAIGLVWAALWAWRGGVRGRIAGWDSAAAVLLPAAWLPSAASLAVPVEVLLSAALALAGLACASWAVRERVAPSRDAQSR